MNWTKPFDNRIVFRCARARFLMLARIVSSKISTRTEDALGLSSTVGGEHRGKASAVHVGYSNQLGSNVGMKIIEGSTRSSKTYFRQLFEIFQGNNMSALDLPVGDLREKIEQAAALSTFESSDDDHASTN